jgi:hypothetical protein
MPPSTVIPVLGYEDVGEATSSETIADVAPVEWGGVSARPS